MSSRSTRGRRGLARAALAIAACVGAARVEASPTARPSFALVVLDTLRWDAVSANGAVEHTTPAIDALAASGVRYTHAYAAAPWTLPSHASLFTGLLPSTHGVGWPRTVAPDGLVMLAETLAAAGYETVCVSENPWVTDTFNLVQGCERHVWIEPFKEPTALEYVRDWLRARPPDRPFFLFLNVLDAHSPYRLEPDNAFVPCCLAHEILATLPGHARDWFCVDERAADLRALHGLYLNGVTRADEKLGAVHAALAAARRSGPLVTMVTSDHGEHFGEHGLVDHLIGVYQPLIHVPLVLHGLPDAAPAVVDEAVSLLDVMPSVLAWAGVPSPPGLPGRRLPTAASSTPTSRLVIAEWDDPGTTPRADDRAFAGQGRRLVQQAQRQCEARGRVRGRMRAAILLPKKLLWYERDLPELYDLARDPGETADLAAAQAATVRMLTRALEAHVAQPGAPTAPPSAAPDRPSPEMIERLRTLGYVDAEPG